MKGFQFFQQTRLKTKHSAVPKKVSLAIKSGKPGLVFSKRNYIIAFALNMYPYPVSGFVGTIPK
jgi:hypothetical protein